MPTPTITVSPTNPKVGDTVTVTTTGLKPNQVLDLDWDPPGLQPATVTVDENGVATFTVPANASSCIVSDPNGDADPATFVVGS